MASVQIVPVPQLNKEELREVVTSRFPQLQPIIAKIIRNTYLTLSLSTNIPCVCFIIDPNFA